MGALSERKALDRTRDYVYNQRFFNLQRIQKALVLFHQPLQKIKIIHVAGSKGKGSVCAMVTAGLCAAGKKVGTFTSPAIFEDREMIAINGRILSSSAWHALCQKYEKKIPPTLTHFETMFVLACLAFRNAGVTYAVIEVGMGGRLDATNVVRPTVTVLCPIEKEHTDLLGSTLAAIAKEKCGILKNKIPAVVSHQKPSVQRIVNKICVQKKIPILWAQKMKQPSHSFGVSGAHQLDNARIAAAVLKILGVPYPIRFRPLLLPGRCTVLREKPLLVVDAAHTAESAKALRAFLDQKSPKTTWIFLFSALADKPIKKILKILVQRGDQIILTKLLHTRAMPLKILQKNAPNAAVIVNPAKACKKVFSLQKHVCIVGSFQIVRIALLPKNRVHSIAKSGMQESKNSRDLNRRKATEARGADRGCYTYHQDCSRAG